MPQIPFHLVTGFLGSGKTTLLKRVLAEHAEARSIAIVQNEFAPSGVDGITLQESGKSFKLLEVNRGSVFCVCLLGDFIPSLANFIDTAKPDIVFLEATGLADPIGVAQMCMSPELSTRLYLAGVFTILDASTFLQLEKVVARVVHQVRIADTVIINKADKSPETLFEIKAVVEKYNPFAKIQISSYCSNVELMLDIDPQISIPVAIQRKDELAAIASSGRPPIEPAVLRRAKPLTPEGLALLTEQLIPLTVRSKGYLKLTNGTTQAIQSVYDDLQMRTLAGYSGPSEFVAMGDKEKIAEFIRQFENLP